MTKITKSYKDFINSLYIVGSMDFNPIIKITDNVLKSYRSLTECKSPSANPACNLHKYKMVIKKQHLIELHLDTYSHSNICS